MNNRSARIQDNTQDNKKTEKEHTAQCRGESHVHAQSHKRENNVTVAWLAASKVFWKVLIS